MGGCLNFILAIAMASAGPAPTGLVEGHVNIVSRPTVELADGTPPGVSADVYGKYPLIVRSAQGERELARVVPNAQGNFGIALPPGVYLLDVEGRLKKRVRAKPQPFTVITNQTVRVDLNIDLGIR